MTSLQKQLASIAASSTHQLDLKAQKTAHSKSLLYEPRVAVTQDFDTIFQICYEGFEELCMLDSRFKAFEKNLFSDQSKGEERSQMTAKENAELDTVLESFLGLVGPRLLLKPALKAIEWLIRRFRVHEYNTEFLLLTFLPYHAAQIFPTLLSILPINISPTFRFLYPYINSLANPPRHVIVYAASQNPAFFSALNQYILTVARARQQSQLFLSFWVSVVTQAVSGMLDAARSGRSAIQQQRQEDLLLRILPVLNHGLALKKAPELILGCYTIMSVLASKASLEDNVLDGLMEAVATTWTTSTVDLGLVSLSVLFQEKHAIKLPKRVLKSVLMIDDLTNRLLNLGKHYGMDRLALGAMLGFLEQIDEQNFEAVFGILERWLDTDLLDDQQKTFFIKALLRKADILGEEPGGVKDMQDKLANFLEGLIENSNTQDVLHEAISTSGINVEKLELKLKTVIGQTRNPQVKRMDDTEMVDRPSSPKGPSLDVLLASLPNTTNIVTFLQGYRPELFDDLVNIFMGCLNLPDGIESFLSTPILSHGSVLEVRALSFFARVWCSHYPVAARSAALEIVIRRLSALEENGADLQALVPYVLSALADPVAKIRRLAGELIRGIRRISVTDNQKHKPDVALKIWGFGTIYAESHLSVEPEGGGTNVKWLDVKTMVALLDKILIPHTQEFALDAEQVVRVLNRALNGSTEGQDKIKSSSRASTFSFLSSHIANTPLQIVRLRLLPVLQGVGKAGYESRKRDVIPALQKWASASAADVKSVCEHESIDFADLDREYIAVLNLGEEECIAAFQNIAKGQVGPGRDNIQRIAFERLRKTWSSLKPVVQRIFADFLLEQCTVAQAEVLSPISREEAAGTLRCVELSSDILQSLVESLPKAASMPETPHPAKRRRTSKSEMAKLDPNNLAGANAALHKITFVLEIVDASKPERHSGLLKGLFQVLGELQDFKAQTHSDLAYLNTLVLDNLLAIIDGLLARGATADHSAINADLVVTCLRSTSSPSVRNAALLLISSLAGYAPALVLHSIMPVFTFMSSSVLRQGDDYSAHIIQKTIQQVVPALTESMRQKGEDLVSGAAELLLSFTAAYEHVPPQRRMSLYGLLAETLGVNESLFALVAMLVERYPQDETVSSFVGNLVNQQKAAMQLHMATKYMDLLSDALQPTRTISNTLLGLEDKDRTSINGSLVTLLGAISDLLANKQLHQKIRTSLQRSKSSPFLKDLYATLLEKVISFSQHVTKQEDLYTVSARLLNSVLNILPTIHFVEAVTPLLDNSDEQLRRSVIRTFEARIRNANRDDEPSRRAMLDLLPRLMRTLQSSSNVLTKHAVVACIDQISERYGKKDPASISSAAQVIASETCLGSTDDRLRTMSLLCLASMIEVLKDDSIPLLPQVLKLGYEYFAQSMQKDSETEQLTNAVFSVVIAVLEQVPYMFSGKHLDKMLRLSHQSARMHHVSNQTDDSRLQFYRLVAMQVDIKECLRAIRATWDSALEGGHLALSEHLDFVGRTIDSNSKSSILRNSAGLFDIVFDAFDVRRRTSGLQVPDRYSMEDLEQTEDHINKTVISMIMKMNDAAFRPFFVRLVDWATTGLSKKDKEGRTMRLNTLFTFLQSFFGELKSIVTTYSSYILQPAVDVLENATLKDADARRLWEAVLRALKLSFEHDQDDFWQAPSHFNSILPPLLSQLSEASTLLNPTPSLFSVLNNTITELAVAVASTDHQKELNAAIMKHTRSDNPDVRLAAVKCEQSLTERLGEEWLGSLSEMLPFISELQQDDDETVERETLRWIKRMEQILGESLDPMLT